MKLNPKLIKNTQLITDRESLFKVLPRNGTIAEIGVAKGKNAISMLSSNPVAFHLFDKDLKRISDSDQQLFKKTTTVYYHEGDDLDLLQKIPNHFFDWVYLDSSHIYEHTWKELQILKDKIKLGGYICGHDYVTFDYRYYVTLTTKNGKGAAESANRCYYNLKQCVNKFCNDNQFELAYLTTELNPSFAIRQQNT